jgi:bacteriorhodopsin
MIYKTAKLSVLVQILTTGINFLALNIPIDPKYNIIKQLLQLEIIVQIIQLIFYLWLLKNFTSVDNITPFRYIDWIFTTPVMLFQLIAFLNYDKYTDIITLFNIYKKEIIKILLLNWSMMIFGLLGELKYIKINIANTIGFVPFIIYFYMIYNNFVPKENNKTNDVKKYLYWYYVIIWALYGVVAYLPYEQKNSSYNILDIFAKNFYGLFLAWYILKLNKTNA